MEKLLGFGKLLCLSNRLSRTEVAEEISMNKSINIIGNTCTYCAIAGFTALGLITAATLAWVMLL